MRVGLSRYVPVALRLRRYFPLGISRDESDRWRQVEALEESDPDAIDSLTEQFFALHNHDEGDVEFREKLAAYIRNNLDEFVP